MLSSLISQTEFSQFTGQYAETGDSTIDSCLETSQIIIEDYLGYKIDSWYETNLPVLIKQTVFRIGALLLNERSGNIGINSKSFGDSGTRSFLNVVDYSKYLLQLSEYKLYFELNNEAKEADIEE